MTKNIVELSDLLGALEREIVARFGEDWLISHEDMGFDFGSFELLSDDSLNEVENQGLCESNTDGAMALFY